MNMGTAKKMIWTFIVHLTSKPQRRILIAFILSTAANEKKVKVHKSKCFSKLSQVVPFGGEASRYLNL